MSSELQINSNRQNSLNSTGPRDASSTRFNATKHGILSKEICIKRNWINEDPTEYTQVLDFIRTDVNPSDVIEELLVEKIAISYWRLRRVLRAEMEIVINHKPHEGFGLFSEDKNLVFNFGIKSLDTLQRYEAMLTKDMYRAINQLEAMKNKPLLMNLIEKKEEN